MSGASGDPAGDVQVVTIAPDGSLGPSVGRDLAHQPPGILHLAVSVALVDASGRWLLQRRAASKAAFPDRWANSCCTHPEPGEDPAAAAIRRVREELGLEVDGLEPVGTFIYRAGDPVSGLVEHELDHVFLAVTDTSSATPDAAEIGELARLPIDEAIELVSSETGTPWAAEVLQLASRRRHGHGVSSA
jgi:isopentenyl-diphosphate Delta-isomerase